MKMKKLLPKIFMPNQKKLILIKDLVKIFLKDFSSGKCVVNIYKHFIFLKIIIMILNVLFILKNRQSIFNKKIGMDNKMNYLLPYATEIYTIKKVRDIKLKLILKKNIEILIQIIVLKKKSLINIFLLFLILHG